jgi:hypothetical protein
VSGSKGIQQGGRYVIQDPRSAFYLPEDKTVIVYFEWDGPLGKHHLEGYWKNPEGKAVVISDFNYENREKRFGGYWSLNLTEGTASGLWTLEARVDGEVTGTHSFQIVSAAKPANAGSTDPQLLTPSQIYQRALAATVTLDRISASGDRLARGSGFFLGDGLVLTAFEVIDGASSVVVQLPSGERLPGREVLQWNRWQDWAILKVPRTDVPGLVRAKVNSWAVGDRCFYLNVSADSGRSIVDVNITGTNSYPNAGERLTISNLGSPETIGSPILNEYGAVIGIVAGSTIPGASSLTASRFGYYASLLRTRHSSDLAVPISLVPESGAAATPVSYADLLAKGQFVPPLAGSAAVGQGSLALRLDNRSGVSPMAQDERYEFTHKDQQFVVLVMWTPKDKRNTTTALRLYDLNNSLLVDGKPIKLNLRPSQVEYTSWKMEIARFPSGTYRIDVLLADQPVWRTFFSVSD